eukprot:COSAG01_NODE_19918_length_982_cov_0.848245_1_plen_43_part_10
MLNITNYKRLHYYNTTVVVLCFSRKDSLAIHHGHGDSDGLDHL